VSLFGETAPVADVGRPDRLDTYDPLSRQTQSAGSFRTMPPVPLDPLPELERPPWLAQWAAENLDLQARVRREAQALPFTDMLYAATDRFAPGCLVRARVRLAVPAPGTVGIVVGYNADGEVMVKRSPDAVLAAGCKQAWIEVVDPNYWDRRITLAQPSDDLDDGDVPL